MSRPFGKPVLTLILAPEQRAADAASAPAPPCPQTCPPCLQTCQQGRHCPARLAAEHTALDAWFARMGAAAQRWLPRLGLAVLLVFLGLALATCAARAQATIPTAARAQATTPTTAPTPTLTVGLHLVSAHIPARDYHHNLNPGVYLRLQGSGLNGLTLGAYHNSLGRTSVYAGHTSTWQPPWGGDAQLTLGVVSGYRKRCTSTVQSTPFDIGARGSGVTTERETTCMGDSNGLVAPLIAPSVALPVTWLDLGLGLGLRPRLTLAAGASVAVHLSLERTL